MVATRRVRRDVDLVDVFLEGGDDHDLEGPGAPSRHPQMTRENRSPDSPGPTRPAAGTARIRRWWPLAAGLAVAVVAGSVLVDRRDQARLAALAELPGILAPLDGPVAELWRTDVALRPGLVEVSGRMVGVESRPDGSVDVVALDPGTGRAAWRANARAPGAVDVKTRCALPEPAGTGDRLVACVVVDEVERVDETGTGILSYPARTRVFVVDAATGAIVHNGPAEPRTSVATLGADLVLSDVGPDGRVRVQRTDARRTQVRWTFTSPDPLPLNSFRRRDASVTVSGGLIVVDGGSGWVLSGAGDELRTWTIDPVSRARGEAEVLPGGRLLFERVPAAGAAGASDAVGPEPAAHIVELATGRSFGVDGYPVIAVPDDRSLPGLLLIQSERAELIAYDLATGRPRWTIPSTGGGGTVIRDGRILRGEGDELQSIDGRTGAVVWAVPAGQAAYGPLVSDGEFVLLTGPDASRGLVLTAYQIHDGRRVWSVDVEDSLYSLVALDGRLFGWGERLVGLGRAS